MYPRSKTPRMIITTRAGSERKPQAPPKWKDDQRICPALVTGIKNQVPIEDIDVGLVVQCASLRLF